MQHKFFTQHYFSLLVGLSLFVAYSYGLSAQYTILDENFDSEYNPKGWKFIDKDGDKKGWHLGQMTIEPAKAHSGEYIFFSQSKEEDGGKDLTPDNLLVTPKIHLSAPGKLTYWIASRDKAHPAEHYGIFISTTDDAADSFDQKLFEETIQYTGTLPTGDVMEPTPWEQRTVTIPANARYIAFRHYNCTGQFLIMLDDVKLTSSQPPILDPEIKVAGTSLDLSKDNSDVLGDGKVLYDAKRQTLTLKDASIAPESGRGLEIINGALTLQLEGENNKISPNGVEIGIYVGPNAELTIAGEGALEVTTFGIAAIGVDSDSKLIIRRTSVTADASNCGILGNNGTKGERIFIDGSYVYATALTGSIGSFQTFDLKNAHVSKPEGASIQAGKLTPDDNVALGIYDESLNPVSTAEIDIQEDLTEDHKITIKPSDKGEVIAYSFTDKQLDKVCEGYEVHFKAFPSSDDMTLIKLTANGKDITHDKMIVMGTNDLEIEAQFGAKPQTHQVTLQSNEYGQISIKGYTDEELKSVPEGTTLTVVATPKDEQYELTSLKANGEEIVKTKQFTVDTKDVEVVATFSLAKSIATPASTTSWSFYPNPATDALSIQAPAGSQLRLLSTTGNLIDSYLVGEHGTLVISLSHLPRGNYLLQLGEESAKVLLIE